VQNEISLKLLLHYAQSADLQLELRIPQLVRRGDRSKTPSL